MEPYLDKAVVGISFQRLLIVDSGAVVQLVQVVDIVLGILNDELADDKRRAEIMINAGCFDKQNIREIFL